MSSVSVETMVTMKIAVSIILCAIAAAVDFPCPPGYSNIFRNVCIKTYANDLYTFDEAQNLCRKDGAELPSIHSEDEDHAISKSMPNVAYWLGIRCDKHYYWTDGTDVDYTPFLDSVSCTADMGDLEAGFEIIGDAVWNMDPLNGQHAAVCMIRLGLPSTGNVCGNSYSYDDDTQTCHRKVPVITTWYNADASCKVNGGYLASIHSEKFNTYLHKLAFADDFLNEIHIGARVDENNTVTWTDGSPYDYSNYDDGMPNTVFGSCTSMQTFYGVWVSESCDRRLPAICTKAIVCPTQNTFNVGSEPTELQSPEYPSSSTTNLRCEYIINARDGEFVQFAFPSIQLTADDTIELFNADDIFPFETILSFSDSYEATTAESGSIRVVYTTRLVDGTRQWSANFKSVPQ